MMAILQSLKMSKILFFSLSNGDLDGVIDNFLATKETSHIGYKYVLLQEYLANDDFFIQTFRRRN